jgi:signal peptidase I
VIDPSTSSSEPVAVTDVPDAHDGTGDDREGSEPTSFARNLAEWVAILVGALVVALLVTRFLVQAFFIPSLSMAPTLEVNDRVLVNKLSYDLHDVNRGDVIVFERPPQ